MLRYYITHCVAMHIVDISFFFLNLINYHFSARLASATVNVYLQYVYKLPLWLGSFAQGKVVTLLGFFRTHSLSLSYLFAKIALSAAQVKIIMVYSFSYLLPISIVIRSVNERDLI